MDNQTSGIIAIVGIVVSVAGSALAIINHKRLRSNCLGKKLEVSLDIEATTPPTSLPPKIVDDKKVSFAEKDEEV